HQTMRGAMSQAKVRELLTRRLRLKDPRFDLEKVTSKLSGSVISSSFKGKTDLQRQQMIWNALEAELGPQALQRVGTLLAYTDDEWDADLEAYHPKRVPQGRTS